MMTKSWRRLAEAMGPGMIDLKKMKDMDRRSGRPDQMPGGSGMFNKDDLDDGEPHPTMRPSMDLPRPEEGDPSPDEMGTMGSKDDAGHSFLNMIFSADDEDF